LKSGSEVTQGHSNGTIRKLGCGFLYAVHSNYGSMLLQLRDKARYWSKVVIFSYSLHSTPPLGGPRPPVGILPPHLVWKNYPTVKNFEVMYNRLGTIPACDRRTDIFHGIVRAMHTRRAIKSIDTR